MKPRKILSAVLALLMAVSMLPSLVFAEELSGELDGRLKIKGTAAVGCVLSADYTKVTPEGVTDDYVTFQWSRKISEDEEPVELGTENEYTLTEEDLGYKIILKITGSSELGLSGELEANTVEIAATADEAPDETTELTDEEKAEAALEAEETTAGTTQEPAAEDMIVEETVTEEPTASEPVTETAETEPVTEAVTETAETEPAAEAVAEEAVPVDEAAITDPQDTAGEGNGVSAASDTASAETAQSADPAGDTDGIETDDSVLDIAVQESLNISGDSGTEVSYSAQASMDYENGIVDFGVVAADSIGTLEAQYVTITNTGSGTLNFDSIAPEHFMIQDVEDPLEPGQSVTLWVLPRSGAAAGIYTDTIIYTTQEGAAVSFEAAVTVTEPATETTTEPATETTTEPVTEMVTDEDAAQADLQNAEAESTVATTQADSSEATTQADSSEATTQADSSEATTQEASSETTSETTTQEASETTSEATTQATTEATSETTTAAPEIVNIGAGTVDFGTLTTGYTSSAQEVTLTNNSSSDASVTISGNTNFDVLNAQGEAVTSAVISANGTLTLKIQLKAGLAAGTYSDTITVTGGAQAVTITAAAVVTDPPVYGITVNPTSIDFGSAQAGYTQPAAVSVTITNTGNTAVNLTQPVGTSFIIGNLSATSLAAGGTATFTVQPNAGLTEGVYQETITVAGDNAQTTLSVGFTVTAAEVKLTGITSPSAITDLTNGTEKSADGLSLPSKVTISTTDGKKRASVSWDVKSSAYSVTTTEKQVFTVKGKVTLPDGVTNPDNISLVTSVKVTVNARVAVVADSANNTISGISSTETYTTETKITITANGAGMDNTDPGSGDTRYIPVSWKVLETRSWDSAPYTATFRMGKGGSYTLEVVFNQQKYDGSAWQNTGSQDTKQVSFTVVDVTGADLTPAITSAAQTSAVQTGDNTPVMEFVIVLVIAVAVIVGVVIYRKKKK